MTAVDDKQADTRPCLLCGDTWAVGHVCKGKDVVEFTPTEDVAPVAVKATPTQVKLVNREYTHCVGEGKVHVTSITHIKQSFELPNGQSVMQCMDGKRVTVGHGWLSCVETPTETDA